MKDKETMEMVYESPSCDLLEVGCAAQICGSGITEDLSDGDYEFNWK